MGSLARVSGGGRRSSTRLCVCSQMWHPPFIGSCKSWQANLEVANYTARDRWHHIVHQNQPSTTRRARSVDMMRATLLLAATAAAVAQGAEPPKNVLFVAVDDMRPSIGAFNFSMAHTPNMDQLAETGLVFKRAYVQYAFCAPSRNSFMSGRRPDTTRVWNFMDHFREEGVGAEWLSM